jgi:hypothetical protein
MDICLHLRLLVGDFFFGGQHTLSDKKKQFKNVKQKTKQIKTKNK